MWVTWVNLELKMKKDLPTRPYVSCLNTNTLLQICTNPISLCSSVHIGIRVRGKIQFWCLIQFAFHPIWWIGVWLEQQCKQFWMCIYNLITIWYHQIFFSHVTKKDWWLHATWILGYTQISQEKLRIIETVTKNWYSKIMFYNYSVFN